MADLLGRGLRWLQQQRERHLTATITYQHATGSLDLPATVGQSTFELIDGNGVVLRVQSRDYLVSAALLSMEPKVGHRIVDDGYVYEVCELAGEPAWRWSDPYHQAYRIHCKEVKS